MTGRDVSPSPKVSVVIPAYNVAGYICDTLESVFAQTVGDFEVIVVNDGSPDTAELEGVLQPYRDRIVYVVQENRGLSGARNSGIRAARGEFIATLDGDDMWMPNYLEVQLGFLASHPETDLVYCNCIFFGDSPEAGTIYMDLCPSSGEVTFESLVNRTCHVFVAVLGRRSAFEKAGPYDESLRSCEDFDLWLRMTAAGVKIGYHREILVRYRKHGQSLSANRISMNEHSIRVLRKALAGCGEGSQDREAVVAALARTEAELNLRKAKRELGRGEALEAHQLFAAANRYYRSPKLTVVTWAVRLLPGLVRGIYLLRERTQISAPKAVS